MATEGSDESRRILRRVGVALIILGAVDIGWMVYCIAHSISYSSSFNIFALISGIYLWRGHPWYIKWVTRAAAFMMTAFALMLLIFPFVMPLDLELLQVKLHPASILGGAAFAVALIGFLAWVYRELRSDSVLTAYATKNVPRSPPKSAFIAGAALVVIVVSLVKVFAISEMGQRAIELARQKQGPAYRYWLSSFSSSGEHGRAVVLADDEKAVKSVDVEW